MNIQNFAKKVMNIGIATSSVSFSLIIRREERKTNKTKQNIHRIDTQTQHTLT